MTATDFSQNDPNLLDLLFAPSARGLTSTKLNTIMKDSEIGWTKHTYNPWEGCTKVSPGCANCYAKTECADRYKRVRWGSNGDRRRVTTTADAPLKWHEEAVRAGRRDKFFCASLCDVFANEFSNISLSKP